MKKLVMLMATMMTMKQKLFLMLFALMLSITAGAQETIFTAKFTAPNVRHWNGATPWSDCECMTVSDLVPGEEHAVQLKNVTDGEFTSPIRYESMIVRLAEIEVYPEHLQEYLKFAYEVDRQSVEREPGVICLFPMLSAEDSTQIRILEIYASEEAYQSHIKTEHFQKYKQGTLHMVKSLKLPTMRPLDPETMKLIFNKQR